MNRKIKAALLAICFCPSTVSAQNSGTMVEEAKYKAAAQVEQTRKTETQTTAPAYQNVQIHETVEEKKAKSQPQCGNCKGAVTPE